MTDEPEAAPIAVKNPLALLDRMVEKGTDPDALKKMMDLVERAQAHHAKAAFDAAMNECQADMPTVVEDGYNDQTKSAYATLESVTRSVKKCYTDHGFGVAFSEDVCPHEAKGLRRIVAQVSHRDGHTRPYWIDLPVDGIGAKGNATSMNAVQGVGSTFSYARRYLLYNIFNITVGGEDNDGQGSGPAGLSDDQTVTLNELLTDYREKIGGPKYDLWLPRFWKWVSEGQKAPVAGLADVHASQFDELVRELQSKIKGSK